MASALNHYLIKESSYNDAFNKLDNPVWYSLSETHHKFALGNESIQFYHPDYCPFGGLINSANTASTIDDYSRMCEHFFVVGKMPVLPKSLRLLKELVCCQMILGDMIEMNTNDEIVPLEPKHSNDLFELVNRVQPGYFREKTHCMGNYFGIFKRDKLISVSGERMQMNNWIELSAVVTDPNHSGKGYAKQLVAHTANNIFRQNKIPFLHVAESNFAAIGLYEKLGFRTRRKISFWNLVRRADP